MIDGIDPTTRALEAYINASVARLLKGESSSTPQNSLLFLGTWQESMPAFVHLDPVLEAVDSRVFAVLWIWAKREGRGSTAFPSYDYLLERCNIHSRATVARALAILRITRWVTLCRRVRDQGRNRGNIYALHDEPLALAATLYLDPRYRVFLERAAHHHHEHVAKVAQAALLSLQHAIEEGENVLAVSPTSQVNQRAEALATIGRMGSGHYFGLRREAITALRTGRYEKQTAGATRLTAPVQKSNADPVQKVNSAPDHILNSGPVQNLNSVLCSSRNNKLLDNT